MHNTARLHLPCFDLNFGYFIGTYTHAYTEVYCAHTDTSMILLSFNSKFLFLFFQGSPFCKLVREVLVELELPHLYRR